MLAAVEKRARERPLHPSGTRSPRAFRLCIGDLRRSWSGLLNCFTAEGCRGGLFSTAKTYP
jgi:hypothetical protein